MDVGPRALMGSLSKAGKSRDRNRINWEGRRLTKDGIPRHHRKKHCSPRCGNRRRYRKQILLRRTENKQWSGGKE